MEGALQLGARPWAGGLPGAEKLRVVPVNIGEDVESAVMVTKGRRPNTLTIDFLPAFQPIRRPEIQPFERVAEQLPVHQILRVQNSSEDHDKLKVCRTLFQPVHLSSG